MVKARFFVLKLFFGLRAVGITVRALVGMLVLQIVGN